MNYNHSYLIRLQYLGFRFHGWQKQPNLKTIHLNVDKTFKFMCKGVRFKTIGVGRTDAKVSSTDYAFQLFIDEVVDEEKFIEIFNINSPSDLRGISIEKIRDKKFNIIQHPKVKEYRYYFSFGEKNHPYCASLLVGFLDQLNIELMEEGAKLFEGEHNFSLFCVKPSEKTIVNRKVDFCRIIENTELTASFFPEKSYILIVKGKGFLRNQIRLMMGALVELGRENIDLNFIQESLKGNIIKEFRRTIAPASGLHLHKITFEK